ncbi:MAG: hypothetical protein A2W10_09805 [Deltaproteobacteria bacterium RBG_16_55_12]|nr:MAG: hypothetical protein A2W10_09805 [Deltaproteobacteria bacterium RBG_16_55_12]
MLSPDQGYAAERACTLLGRNARFTEEHYVEAPLQFLPGLFPIILFYVFEALTWWGDLFAYPL